jgi:hypothetical protein
MTFGLTGLLKQLVNRERFVEYSTPGWATAQGFSNSGLGWFAGQAYIKGLCVIQGGVVMNYDELMKTGRITALKEFFQMNGKEITDHYANWFYENFLGICKNLGFLYGNGENLNDSPYAEMAMKIYSLAH